VTVVVEQLEWHTLSAGARWTLREIVFREQLGWTRQEVSEELRLAPAEIGKRMSALRAELRAQADER
jgi:type II secretory pathway component HofQ